MASTLERLERRLDKQALKQLREIATKLHEELEQTRMALERAEENAEFWREQVMNIQLELYADETKQKCIGMTVSGEMTVVSKSIN